MASPSPRLFIALYTDEDVHKKLARQLRERKYDVVSAYEVGTNELQDDEQLEYAISQERAILTFNSRDFAVLHKEYKKQERKHFGIIVSEQLTIGETLRRVVNMLDRIDADQMKGTYHDLGEFK